MRKSEALRIAKETTELPRGDNKLVIQQMQRNFVEAAQAADRKLVRLQRALLGPQARGG
jgi:hypothetical protein